MSAVTGPVELNLVDVGPFLGRLLRLDRGAVVRVRRPAGVGPAGRVSLWGRVPWEVLVTRTVPAGPPEAASVIDMTVSAGGLLAALSGGGAWPSPRDADWRWPVPPSPGTAVERIPAAQVIGLGAAAAATLRDAAGRMGERMLRDTLLDHVAIEVVAGDGERPPRTDRDAGDRRAAHEDRDAGVAAGVAGHAGVAVAAGHGVRVRQRLIQAALRMGFIASSESDDYVTVRTVSGWVGLSARYGTVWRQDGAAFAVHPIR